MKHLSRLRPTPALVISVIALFVSLGGVSYGVATGYIDGREIRDNTVSTKDLRNNDIRTKDIRNNEVRGIDIRNSTLQGRDVALATITGEDVNEATLSTVPRATAADGAATVGGISMKKVSYLGEQGTGFVPVLDFGGLRLEASCEAGPQLVVRANPAPTLPNSEVQGGGVATGADVDFDPGDNLLVVPSASAAGAASVAFLGSNGGVVTLTGAALEDLNGVRGTAADCGFFGVAEAG